MKRSRGADALVIVTEWKEFKSPDFVHLKQRLKTPLIFDGRNLYEPEAMAELGIDYHCDWTSLCPTFRRRRPDV